MVKLKLQLGEDVFEAEGDLDERFIGRAFFVWLQLQSSVPERINELADKLDRSSDALASAVAANQPPST